MALPTFSLRLTNARRCEFLLHIFLLFVKVYDKLVITTENLQCNVQKQCPQCLPSLCSSLVCTADKIKKQLFYGDG